MDILKGEGLEPVPSVGLRFDPYRHEALMQVTSQELEDGFVAQELQRGYTLHSKVLRTAKVAVVTDNKC
jgi:molecular chaperone GrpE